MIEEKRDSVLGDQYVRLKINGEWITVQKTVADVLERNTAKLYFEAHVTIEPVFGRGLNLAKAISEKYNFKVAELLMKKRENDTPQRSRCDTFMTGHAKHLDELKGRMVGLIAELRLHGFKVRRAKVENTVMDTRNCDDWRLLT